MRAEQPRFRNDPRVYQVLGHYDKRDAVGPAPWRERLMDIPGVAAAELSRLHGLLLAYGWIVQGPALGDDGRCLSSCYRITPAGQRALHHFTTHVQQHVRPGAA